MLLDGLPAGERATVKWEPHEYQKRAVHWLCTHQYAALFLEPGLGKTSCTLTAFLALRKQGLAKRALIVAPLRPCYSVWSHEGGELSKWDQFAGLKVALLHGSDKEDRLKEEADIYVVNFDGLPWISGKLPTLIKRGVDTLIIDELSKLKHTKTMRFKTIKPHLRAFKRRWGLTGSPASNGLLDLFGQAFTIDLGASLGTFITHYRFRYFLPTGFNGYVWQIKPGAEAEIYKAVEPWALSMKARDHLDLPDLVEQNLWVNLPPKAMQTYARLESDLIAQIEGNTVTASNVAVASLKCRQVASGGIYADAEVGEKRRTLDVHSAKTEALCDLVDELQGSPLLIAYEFEHDLQRIRKALGDVPAINGSSTQVQSTRLVEQWNAGTLPLLAGHPAAMGHGLNLQASGSHIAWYSLTWDFELYDQLVRRVWRQGQKNRVVVHRILARKTVDEAVVKALGSKKRKQDALFDALKERGRQ